MNKIVIDKLVELIDEGKSIDREVFAERWERRVQIILNEAFDSGIGVKFCEIDGDLYNRLTEKIGFLESIVISPREASNDVSDTAPNSNILNNIEIIKNLCNRFHLVAKQLCSRYSNRETLVIKDEYDTQDLLHALLRLYFDDIRPEEWTPSYAGSCSRVDFLLKEEQLIIEVKKTRKNLKSKQIGEELLIDMQRYQKHPDCKF